MILKYTSEEKYHQIILAVKYISGDGDESCGLGHSDREYCNNKGINNSIVKKVCLSVRNLPWL